MACGEIPGVPDRRPGSPVIPADGGGRFLQHLLDGAVGIGVGIGDPGGNRLGPVRRSTGASRRPGMSRSLSTVTSAGAVAAMSGNAALGAGGGPGTGAG